MGMRSPSAWFIADPPTDVAGFSKARLFRPSRAYIRKKEDEVYELQINVVDLRTGSDRDLSSGPEPPRPEAKEEIDLFGARLQAFRCRVEPTGMTLWLSPHGGVLRFDDGKGLTGALEP